MWQTYIAIGDSVTEGYGDAVDEMPVRGWTDLVADVIRDHNPNLSYKNLGYRGKTAVDVIDQQLPVALASSPDLVSITVGGNDARERDWQVETFMERLGRLVAPFAELNIDVILLAYPNLLPAIQQQGRAVPAPWRIYFERVVQMNDAIRKVSATYQTCLLDLADRTDLQNPAYLSQDLTHYNALGYRAAASASLEIMAKHFVQSELLVAADSLKIPLI